MYLLCMCIVLRLLFGFYMYVSYQDQDVWFGAASTHPSLMVYKKCACVLFPDFLYAPHRLDGFYKKRTWIKTQDFLYAPHRLDGF